MLWNRAKIKWFRQFLDLKHGIPSHDTFNDVLNRLNPTEFSTAFTQWVTEISKHKEGVIALDGKVMRRTLDKVSGMSATHLVSAWSVENNFCLGQVKVADKSNEITAIPILLALMDIKEATITTDAMGCQYKIGEQVVTNGGNYVLGLKGNQGEFYDDVKLYLDTQLKAKFKNVPHSVHSSLNGDHGRIENREVWLTTDIDWRVERHPRWKSLKSIALICSTREVNGISSYEQRYYISSHEEKDAAFIADAIRTHWHVENKLHWQLDVSFNQDQNRLRSGFAAQNIGLINKIALNLLKNEKSVKVGIKSKRLKAGWDNAYMMKVLTVGLTV
jgi:predicted transposase YbfD/YdcC